MKTLKFKFILLLLLVTGCSKSYIIEQPVITKADTTYTPRAIQKDTSEVESSDIPIEFDVDVESWE